MPRLAEYHTRRARGDCVECPNGGAPFARCAKCRAKRVEEQRRRRAGGTTGGGHVVRLTHDGRIIAVERIVGRGWDCGGF